MDYKTLNQFALMRTRFTPDIAELEQHQFVLLFVCDDVMRAGKNYSLISEHSTTVARGFTQRTYNFYQKNTDGTGIVMSAKQPENRYDFSSLRIKGEFHLVETEAILKLDTHYQNGVQFRRIRSKFLYPTRQHGQIVNRSTDGRALPYTLQGHKHFLLPERVDIISAWMYIGVPSYWNPLLDGGFAFSQVNIEEPKEDRHWLPKYYRYLNRK